MTIITNKNNKSNNNWITKIIIKAVVVILLSKSFYLSGCTKSLSFAKTYTKETVIKKTHKCTQMHITSLWWV